MIERFRSLGLDVMQIWHPCPHDPALELSQLHSLEEWVVAYWSFDGREGMEAHGFDFPPVEPGIDSETDWLRFERWISRKPLSWNLHGEASRLQASSELTNEEVACCWRQLASLPDKGNRPR
ncbi:MAG: hypothetical protein KJ626_03495 [Verrucomicrobia bacterium]|nr:hypothetical protein [Verrucomicrobiota bacterium]